jgi:hypothetical protein
VTAALRPARGGRGSGWKEAGALLALAAAALILWDTWAVYPLKVLVIFFHEMSHGLAALLTGGSIERIEVVSGLGGLCVTRGGKAFFIASAGYLGSMAWGGVILVLAARTRADRAVMGALGGLLVLVSLIWVRPFLGFGMSFGLLAGGAMGAAAVWLRREVNDFLLKLIGLTSCLYAVLDLKSDILDRPSSPSDARILAELTGVPAIVWGLVWTGLAIAGSLFFLSKTRDSA